MIAAPLLSLVFLAPSSGATPPALEAASPKAAAADGQEPVASTSVGMRVRIEELPIAGPKLQARPVADPGLATAIVRVLNVFPHGTGWRYNLEVTPFEEGTLDLAALLEPAEAGAPWDPPVLKVVVEALLAPEEVEPSDLDVPVPESVGGYRTGMTLLAAAWLAGLLALLTVGRRKDERATVREAPLQQRGRSRALRSLQAQTGAQPGSFEGQPRVCCHSWATASPWRPSRAA